MGLYKQEAKMWGVVTQKLNGQRGSVYEALINGRALLKHLR